MADGLSYDVDGREELTKGQKAAFKEGWRRAVGGGRHPGDVDELTWESLGWRLGSLFGETSAELKDDMFEWCLAQQDDPGRDAGC